MSAPRPVDAGARTLILIRHATPVLDFSRPPREWRLSEQGREECRLLAERLADAGLTHLFSSAEPKAAETARKLASGLGIGWQTWPDLHEHGVMPEYGPDEWHALIRRLFERLDELVMGLETANQALARFSRAVDALLAATAGDPVGVVSHGTVISLYAAALTSEPGYAIWRR